MAIVTMYAVGGEQINEYLVKVCRKANVDDVTVKAKFNDLCFTIEPGMSHEDTAELYNREYQKRVKRIRDKEAANQKLIDDKLHDYEFLYSFAKEMYENMCWRPETNENTLREKITQLRRRLKIRHDEYGKLTPNET
jgi:hypothetical protein